MYVYEFMHYTYLWSQALRRGQGTFMPCALVTRNADSENGTRAVALKQSNKGARRFRPAQTQPRRRRKDQPD